METTENRSKYSRKSNDQHGGCLNISFRMKRNKTKKVMCCDGYENRIRIENVELEQVQDYNYLVYLSQSKQLSKQEIRNKTFVAILFLPLCFKRVFVELHLWLCRESYKLYSRQ